MANEVRVLDPPRAIGWRPGYRNNDGDPEFGGWIWHYDLAPLGPPETEVTLTYDWSAGPGPGGPGSQGTSSWPPSFTVVPFLVDLVGKTRERRGS